MKRKRHDAIIRIITERVVETQGQLTEQLIAEGHDVTQATVSRDIKELRLIKISDKDNRYKYALPGRENDADIKERYTTVLKHSTVTVQNAMNMVVVKTIPGSAQACAMAIETLGFKNIVGVIAGDDTVFLAMNSISDAEGFIKELSGKIG